MREPSYPHVPKSTSTLLPGQFWAVPIEAASLSGLRIKKVRHRLRRLPGAVMAVDEFEGRLAGLVLAEAEFETPDLLAGFPKPDFATREVTDDPRFTGSYLGAVCRSQPD